MKKNLMFIVIALVCGGGGMGATMFLKKPAAQAEESHSKAKKEHPKKNHSEEGEGTAVPLDDFVVNLADTEEQHYLKATVALEMPGTEEELKEQMKTITPQIRDAILMLMSRRHFRELQSTEGKKSLKEAIKKEVNRVLDDDIVSNVYFTAFAMQ